MIKHLISLSVFLILLVLSSSFVYASTQQASTIGPICGNGIKELGEQCDKNDFNGKSCVNLGFFEGEINCSALCKFNTNNCITIVEANIIKLFNLSTRDNQNIINTNNSAKIDLLENFYNQDLTSGMLSYTNEYFSSSKKLFIGKSFINNNQDLIFINQNSDKIIKFSKNSNLILTYANENVSDEIGKNIFIME